MEAAGSYESWYPCIKPQSNTSQTTNMRISTLSHTDQIWPVTQADDDNHILLGLLDMVIVLYWKKNTTRFF